MSESSKKPLVIFVYSALILSTLLVFWQVCNFDFVNYDDDDYVYENPDISNGLSYGSFIAAFTTPHVGNWLPLTWLSFIFDCQLFGMDPGWMHFVNLLLHLANTLLLFTVLKKMTGAQWQSAFVAAAFALHPMHVESVAWITERKDVLSTFFLLLTLAAYIGYVKRRGLFRYMLTVLLFALGLMAKPMLVTLPLLLLLLDYWPLSRFDAQSRKHDGRAIPYGIMLEKIPFFVLAAASSVITFLVQRAGGTLVDPNWLPLQSRVANAFLSYAKYIGKMFWPQNLAVFYPFDVGTIGFWQVVLCALLMIVVSAGAIRFGRKQKYLLVGWLWFVLALIPVIGLVQSGAQSYADRYTYIPYIGLFIMIAWGLPEFLSKWPQRKIALGIAAVMVLTAMGIGTYRQAGYWNNSTTLFSHAIEVTQDNDVAYNNLGVAYDGLGRGAEAIDAYKQAIRIRPEHAEAYNNLGNIYRRLGRWQDAVDAHEQAIKIKPDDAKASYNLGVAYDALGRGTDAIDAYKRAIRIKPDYAEAHNNRGVVYGKLGRWQDAIDDFREAIRIKPDYVKARNNLARVLAGQGEPYVQPATKPLPESSKP
jgi:tetratricopeptide (TPR) repeat protein